MPEKEEKKEYRPNPIVLFGVGAIFFLLFVGKLSPIGMSLAYGLIFSLLTADQMLQQKKEVNEYGVET